MSIGAGEVGLYTGLAPREIWPMLAKAPYAAIALSLIGLAISFAGALAPAWFAPYTERFFHGGGLLAVGGLVTAGLLKRWGVRTKRGDGSAECTGR